MKKPKKFNFTKRALEVLPVPKEGRAYYYDAKMRGLTVAITPKGTISFLVYRKVDGKPERVTLGQFPDLSVENARNKAAEVNAQIAQGKNPNQEKSKLRKELTLKELFDQYLAQHAKLHKKSWKGDVDQYRLYLSVWDKRKLSSIRKADVARLHANIGSKHGQYVANRALALLSVMFNKALHWGWEGSNPVTGIQKFRERSRERFLHGDELPRFFKALADEENESLADFFLLSLLTGARRSNMLAMRWEDVDLDNAIWRIPETKNGSSQIVALSDEVIKVLNKRLTNGTQSSWVFPSATSQSGHVEEPKNAWKRVLERAGLSDLRIHDLRRTLGSWQAATGANTYVIGKSLGHKTPQATAIYARLNIDPVRESVKKATEAMMGTANE